MLEAKERRVWVTGSLGFDVIMDFPGLFSDRIMPDRIHALSLSFLVDRMERQHGGTAGNIAYTLKLLDIDPLIVSAAGNDFSPYREFLNDHGITTEFICVYPDTGTGVYTVITDKDDNQIGAFFIGATKYNHDLTLEPLLIAKMKVEGEKTQVSSHFVVIAPNSPEAIAGYVAECQIMGIPYMYDPAFQIDHFTGEELAKAVRGTALLIGNDYEIALIERKMGVSHDFLVSMAPITITTLAGKGSLIETRTDRFEIPSATPKEVIDPTGAGDAYRAGFLAGFLRGLTLPVCGRMGSVAATYAVENYGTQRHTFTLDEFIRRYEANFGTSLLM